MSWAEVTKINSDLSVPLNELIEDKKREYSTNSFKYLRENILTSLGETTIIDVQGSGLLWDFQAMSQTGSFPYYAIVRVAIDGEYVVNIERTSGEYNYCMYSLPFTPTSTSGPAPVIYSSSNGIDLSSLINCMNTYYADLPFEATSMSNDMYSWLSKPLKFSESLVISIGHSSSANYRCLYELLD